MNQTSCQELTKMLNAFPHSPADLTALLLTYDEDLAGISDQAICETAQRYRRGEIPDQNKKFSPSIAEFVEAAKLQAGIVEIRNRPPLPAPKPYQGTGSAPFERTQAKAQAANVHLPVLFTEVSYDRWCHLSKTRQIPTGAKWVACLGTVYGLEPRHQREVAE